VSSLYVDFDTNERNATVRVAIDVSQEWSEVAVWPGAETFRVAHEAAAMAALGARHE
jgi:hypothetical protein